MTAPACWVCGEAAAFTLLEECDCCGQYFHLNRTHNPGIDCGRPVMADSETDEPFMELWCHSCLDGTTAQRLEAGPRSS